jgi:hypothetical protein
MHSIRSGSVRHTSIPRPSASGRAAAGRSSGRTLMQWCGTRSATRSKKNAERAVRIRPLSGIASGNTTSNTEMRSVATMSRRSASTS